MNPKVNQNTPPSVISSTSVIPVQTGIYTNPGSPIESGMTNCIPSFTVSITDPVARDIKFNYWLIQTK